MGNSNFIVIPLKISAFPVNRNGGEALPACPLIQHSPAWTLNVSHKKSLIGIRVCPTNEGFCCERTARFLALRSRSVRRQQQASSGPRHADVSSKQFVAQRNGKGRHPCGVYARRSRNSGRRWLTRRPRRVASTNPVGFRRDPGKCCGAVTPTAQIPRRCCRAGSFMPP
jgi:hypothetical protein